MRTSYRRMIRPTVPRRRRGLHTIHVLLIFPLLLVAVLAILQFSLVTVVEGGVQSAARAGADVASRGGRMSQILAAIGGVLETHGIEVPVGPEATDGNVLIVIEVPELPQPLVAGNPAITVTPTGPTLRDGEVRITVCVQLVGDGSDPVPNWLRLVGFSMEGQHVFSSALAVREAARSAALVSRMDAAIIKTANAG